MLNYFRNLLLSSTVILLLLLSSNKLFSQDIKGTEFWFTLSKATPLASGASYGNFVYIVSDFCIDDGAYIEIPGLNWRQDFTVVRGQYTEIQIPININGSTSFPDIIKRIQNKGIHIVTPKPVTVYLATVDQASSDGETILPVNYLGTEYVSAIRSNIANGGIYNIIVGTEDNTTVNFKSWNGGGNPIDETITINKGETYFWYQARGSMCDSEYPRGLAGDGNCATFDNSIVKSDKPVAVMGTADCSWGWDCGACEVLIDMPLPTSRWGYEYATVQSMARTRPNQISGGTFCGRSPEISGDFVEVIGEVGTKVYVSNKDGKDVLYTIPAPVWDNGANYGYGNILIEASGSTAAGGGDYGFANNEIKADNPIQVIQYPKGWQTDNQGSADPEAIMVSPINMWKSSYLFAILFKAGATTSNTIAIITEDPNPQIELNGNLIGGWIPIANTNYKYVLEPTLLNVQTNRIINLNGIPFGISMVAAAQANSFVTTGGSGDVLEVSQCPDCPIAEFDTNKDAYCDGEEVVITDLSQDDDPSGATKIVKWDWDYGDGTSESFTTSTNPRHTFPGPGNYTITLSVTNNGTDPGPCTQTYTISIKIGPGITVDAGDDFTGCEGDQHQLGGAPTALGGLGPLTYTWTNAGDLDNGTIANPTLTLNNTTTYRVTVNDSINCTVFDEVDITTIPIDSVYLSPVGSPVICTGDDYQFKVNSTPGNGGPYDITLTDGSSTFSFTGINQGDNITVSPPSTKDYNITSVTGSIPNACIRFSLEKLNVNVRPVPTVSIVSAQSPICEGEDSEVKINLTGDRPWNIAYTFGGNSNNLNNINSNLAVVNLTPASSGVFEITNLEYSNNPKCAITVSETIDIQVNTNKNPGTDNSIDLCVTDAVINLTSLLGTGIDQGTWIDQNNSGALDASGNFNPTLAGSGTFIAQHYVTGDNPCPDTSAYITINVNGTPQASNIVDTCNADLQGYVVRFDISGGDPDSYASNEGTITGNGDVRQFVSNQTYANKTTYTITVTDQYGCGSLDLSNYVNCGCKTKSGSMAQTALESCETDSIDVNPATGSLLLSGDTLLYVLHSGTGNTIVNANREQADTKFGFDPNTMTYGQTYYVSSVAGPALNGSVDYSSDCVQISQGQPVTWYKQVTATAQLTTPDVCTGNDAKVNINFTGNGPFTAKIKGTTLPEITYTNLTSVETITIPITESDNIIIEYYADQYCESFQTIENEFVTARDNPALKAPEAYSCDGNLENYVVTFDVIGADTASMNVISLIGTGTYDKATATFTSDPITSGNAYHFQFSDQFNCSVLDVQGQYTCQCISDAGTLVTQPYNACKDGSITLIENGDKVTDGNDKINFAVHPNPSYAANEVIKYFPTNTITLQAGMTEETTYYVTPIVGSDSDGDGLVELTDGCLSIGTTSYPLLFFGLPHGTFDAPAYAKVCDGANASLPLTIAGKAPFTVETLDSEGNSLSNTINASGDNFVFTPVDTLTIDIVRITDANGCVSTIKDRATVEVLNAPELTLSTTTPNICLGESLDIDLAIKGEIPFNFDLVDDQGNTFNFVNILSNTETQSVSPTTTTEYQVINLTDDVCIGQPSNKLTVTVNSLPAGLISGNTTLCDGDNLTLVVDITGGQAPYNVDLASPSGTKTVTINSNQDNVNFNYNVGNNQYSITKITDGSALQCVGQGNFIDVEVHALPNGDMLGEYQVCQNDSIDIDFELTGDPDFVFNVVDDLGNVFGPFSSNNQNGSVNIKFDTPGDRTVRVETIADSHCPNPNPNGLLAKVSVIDIPVIDIIADNPSGCVPLAVNVINNTDLTGVESCTWTLNGTPVQGANCNGFSKVFTEAGSLDLDLQLKFVSGCVRSNTFPSFINPYAIPEPDFIFNPNQPTIVNPIVNFENTSFGSINGYWTIDSLAKDTGNHISFVFPNDSIGIYNIGLDVISEHGCTASINKLIKIDGVILFYMPSAFTPNGDGVNEGYGPVVNGTDNFINSYTYSVYNRWGEQLFTTNNIGETWDGTYRGVPVKPDAYNYRVMIRSTFSAERIEHIGTFVVLR